MKEKNIYSDRDGGRYRDDAVTIDLLLLLNFTSLMAMRITFQIRE